MEEFRYLENLGQYGVTAEGRVFNHRTEYWLGENSNGYCQLHLKADDGTIIRTSRHRLVARLFHGEVPFAKAVVNHLNGIPGDDRPDNLEWTTYQGNAEHAGALGLTTKCIPVSVRKVSTGEVKHYPSAIEASRRLGISKFAVLWRINAGEDRQFSDGHQFRYRNDDKPWAEAVVSSFGRSRPVVVLDTDTGKIKEFDKQSDAAGWLNVSLSSLNVWVASERQPLIKHRYLVKASDDLAAWRVVSDPYRETYNGKAVVAIKDDTGEETLYATAKDCAAAHGLKVTTLNERLNTEGTRAYKDGYRYRRY